MKPKEEWIQKTFESLDNTSQAEPNPYLFEKIINRMQQERSGWIVSKKLAWKLSVGFAVLLLLNIATIKKYHSLKTGNSEMIQSSGNEYSFQFNYNY